MRSIGRFRFAHVSWCWLLLLFIPLFPASTLAADINECRELLLTGKYEECLATTAETIENGVYGESWHLVKAEAEFLLGRHTDSMATIQSALERYGWSVRLRWMGIRVGRCLNQTEQVEQFVAEIAQLVQSSPWRYTDAENLVTLGEFVLEQGADAKQAQDAFFSRARRNNPLNRVPIIALGELALAKRDFQLAAETFQPALENHPNDPEMHFGLARAFASSDAKIADEHLKKCLEINPHYAPALLFQVDHFIDSEQYADAEELITQVLETNPTHAEALAFRAVTSILQSNADDQQWEEIRTQALSTWQTNPLVDHTIGRKLSQKYRFEQGATHQRQALEFNPDYLPAQKQLIQDLLRLGKEEEGWRLADQVYGKDPYDIAVYNLVTLRDELEKFTTLEAEGLQIRMGADEANIYGHRVVKLLTAARESLTDKYQQELPETILVEIFPRPADFEVRTFGMPGVVGFLGVCFGDVITANSPASQDASPVNLESVLWHEFAHVITLNKTHNRMPRWLSEGISVYEERQRDSSWGERMNLAYRKMILEGELSPIGDMSQMFLSPKSALHVQFAYFQSSLIVEHLIDEYGFDSLLKILDDLAVGMEINEAIERHTVPLAQLDEEFSKYVMQLAEDFGHEIEWQAPDLTEFAASDNLPEAARIWVKEHPREYGGLKAWARLLIERQEYTSAIEILEEAISLFPYETGEQSPYLALAAVYRELKDLPNERKTLHAYTAQDDDAAAVFLRLIEIAEQQTDWPAVDDYSSRLLAIKPLTPQPHASLARANEALENPDEAVRSIDSLLLLNPADRADLYYRKALQLQKLQELDLARRSTLQALEQAPRYEAALTLLLKLNPSPTPTPSPKAQ